MTHDLLWPVVCVNKPAAGEVFVYRSQVTAATAPGLLDCLTRDERERADRFLLESARARFVMARAGLRRILGACLDLAPAAVPICYGPTGKPALDSTAPQLHFNVSHAGDWVLYALAADRPVGIDIEPVDSRREFNAIVARHFSAQEQAQFAAIPSAQRCAAFYQTWARKEALAKATGEGLWLTLGRYSVPASLAMPDPCTLSILPRSERGPATPAIWTLRDLAPAANYAGALAAEGAGWTCRRLTLE